MNKLTFSKYPLPKLWGYILRSIQKTSILFFYLGLLFLFYPTSSDGQDYNWIKNNISEYDKHLRKGFTRSISNSQKHQLVLRGTNGEKTYNKRAHVSNADAINIGALRSVYIPKGFKITFYTGHNYKGRSYELYHQEGIYNGYTITIVNGFLPLPTDYNILLESKSFKIELYKKDLPVIEIRYAIRGLRYKKGKRAQFDGHGDNYFIQRLGIGDHRNVFLNQWNYYQFDNGERHVAAEEACEDRFCDPKYPWYIKKIYVPEGVIVTVGMDDGTSIEYPRPQDPSSAKWAHITTDFPDYYGRVRTISVRRKNYKLKEIKILKASSPVPVSSEKVVRQQVVASVVPADGTLTISAQSEVSNSYSVTVSKSKESSHSNEVGASLSVSVGITVKAAPLGIGAEASFSSTFGVSYSHAWTETSSKSKGTEKGTTKSYINSASYECPPGSRNCRIEFKSEKMKQTLTIQETVVMVDESGKEIPGTEEVSTNTAEFFYETFSDVIATSDK